MVFDNAKIKRFVPAFQATLPFYIGISKTVSWFDEDQRRKRVDQGVNAAMDALLTAYRSVVDADHASDADSYF